jgi:hypothetical protein
MLKKLIENKNIQLIFICFLMIFLYTTDISKGELFYNNDETRHAFTGVFIHDLIRDLPLNPLQYTYEYYAQYPALGIIQWPPFFYFVESIFYFVFGISAVSGRMAILFFALIGIIFWYKLVLKIYNKKKAFFSSILLLTCQPILLFSKVIMLEIPALTLSIVSIYYFISYIIDNKKKDVYMCLIFLALSTLTKQSAIFPMLLFFIYLIIHNKFNIVFRKDVILSGCIFAVLTIPYYIYASSFGSMSKSVFSGSDSQVGRLYHLDTYMYYIKTLPGQVGWIILILFFFSILQIIKKNKIKKNSLPIVWILVCYAVFTAISDKDPRYIIYWIPPIVLLAVCFIDSITFKSRQIALTTFLLVIISISQVVYASRYEKPYICGYEKAAKYILNKTDNGIAFFNGYLDANLIFHIRKHDVDRKLIILRGGKTLVSTNVIPKYGISYIAKNQQDIINIFKDYGIKYIIVEDKDIEDINIYKSLRNLLKDRNKFNMINKISIDSNMAQYKDMNLLIYEYKESIKRRKSDMELKMLTLGGEDITLNLDKRQERR